MLSFDKELKTSITFSRPNSVGSNCAKMTESTRPRPSSPIVRGKAVEVEMSRWFLNLGVLMIVLKGAGKETPTSLPRIGGGKDQHWITWLSHLDDHDHHKGNDHYHLSRQALTASELLLLQREAAENPGNVREKKLKKIRPFFKNPLHSLRK